MILSHTHRFIFICSSKVGTTSMEQVLAPLQEGAAYEFDAPNLFPAKHVPPAMLRAALPVNVWDEYFKFVFVRNPWDWFVSQWCYNPAPSRVRDAPSPQGTAATVRRSARDAARRLGLLRSPTAHVPARDPGNTLQAPPVGDELVKLRASDVDAVFELLKIFRGLPGRDGLYQSSWVQDMDGRQLVDYVGRYETLESDFAHVCAQLGLDLRLPHLNRTRHRDYRSYYSDEARARVQELWQTDIRSFGYDFDGPLTSAVATSG